MKTKSAKEMFDFIYGEYTSYKYIAILENMIESRSSYHDWVINHDNVKFENGVYTYNSECEEKTIVLDIYYMEIDEDNIQVMIVDDDGLDHPIAEVNISEDIKGITGEEHRQEVLYQLAYDIAHDKGYILEGELS
jgi:hypothetical protein